MQFTRKDLIHAAISHTFFPPTTLSNALTTLGFVQADPIRSPARAQDLILRHRVNDYHVNDLEKSYPALGIEEDFLYAYGFITRDLQQYLHPRKLTSLGTLEKEILAIAQDIESLDSRKLETIFGKKRVINAWGGHSQAIKVALDNLHYAGMLRVHGRDKGRRLYARAQSTDQAKSLNERLERLILAIVHILYPVTERTLHESLSRTRQHIGKTKPVIDRLVKSGVLERHRIDQITYLWPADALKDIPLMDRNEVKFLAPFDPLVWDRRRFEHLWGWPYRFEAYTPPSKRVRGYYAMPLLWRDRIIGWTNVTKQNSEVTFEHGYIDEPVRDSEFNKELGEEVKRMKTFLQSPHR